MSTPDQVVSAATASPLADVDNPALALQQQVHLLNILRASAKTQLTRGQFTAARDTIADMDSPVQMIAAMFGIKL